MAQAELVIKSDSVEKTTSALERLIAQFEKLDAAANKNNTTNNGQAASQNKVKTALDQAAASQQKAISLLELERQGLDKNSIQYAKLRAEILAKDIALKKGIKTDSEEYAILLKSIKVREQVTARTKQMADQQKALDKANKGNKTSTNSVTSALDGLSKQASLVDGPLGGVASRITTLSGILKGVGGAGALAFAGIGIAVALFTREMAKGLSVAMDAEVQMRTFEAQVKATGGAAGITANQMDYLARSLAMSTLDNRKGVSELITVMTTFGNVSGKAFERSIGLAQDLGVTMKIGSVGAARALGKALENPMENYSQLVRMGVEFNDAEQERIAILQQTGKLYEAQSIILDKLDAKTGGAAARQADSLAGDLDTFGQKWEEAFERAAKNLLPLSRDVTQLGIKLLDVVQVLSETDVETNFRTWRDSVDLIGASVEDLNKQLDISQKKQKELSEGAVQERSLVNKALDKTSELLQGTIPLWGQAYLLKKQLFDEVDTDTLSITAQEIELEKQKIATLKETIEAKEGASKGTAKLSDEQSAYLKQLDLDIKQQQLLTDAYKKSGDTRSEYYQNVKAGIDAENAANKVKLGFDKERVAQIKENLVVLAQLTEQRVIENTVLQKTKALRNKSEGLKQEIDFYEILKSGVDKNSDAYIRSTAAIIARNSAITGSIPLGGAEEEQIKKSTIALLEQEKALSIISALKATDGNSSTVKALERQLALQDLINSGVAKNSSEYFKEVAVIDTVNTANRLGLEIGSAQYEQLLQQNTAIAEMRDKLELNNRLKDLGLEKDSLGKVIAEDTREALIASGDSLRGVLDSLLASGEIDKSLYEQKIGDLKETLLEGMRELSIPLGITIDEDGKEVLLTSIEAIEIEKNTLIAELETAFREGQLTDIRTFEERKNEIEKEYTEKSLAAKEAAFKNSADHKARMEKMEVAGTIQAGLENLAAVKGNNKALTKAAKAMAMFNASVSLVDSIAEANSKGFPANIPLIAKAFTQGTQLISMASNLNEPNYAFGGVDIEGAGTGRSDSIKANIARGESVITAPATSLHKETLKRMNAGLPIGSGSGGGGITSSPSITIQGNASEDTVALIKMELENHEERFRSIARGVSTETIQFEQNVGGFLNPI